MSLVHLAAADPGCGPKAARLGVLLRAGFAVPDGFVATGAPPETARLREQLERLHSGLVAVRSSALVEDAPTASWAGQFLTVLGVSGAHAVASAIERCALSGRVGGEGPETIRAGSATRGRIPVLVQRLVAAETSGVLFTQDPVTGWPRSVINATWGLGEPLVQGSLTPDTYYVTAEATGQRVEAVIGSKRVRHDVDGSAVRIRRTAPDLRTRACLSPSRVLELARLGRDLEDLLGAPQDIEWAVTGETLWVLQSRPITTTVLGPAAAPSAGPVALVRGTGASRGRVTASVRLLSGPEGLPDVRPGDIVVCHTTDPAWTPVFRIAGGIVTQEGGILCHAAILAREMGIPAVVGVNGALTALTAGRLVTLDGTAGTVTEGQW